MKLCIFVDTRLEYLQRVLTTLNKRWSSLPGTLPENIAEHERRVLASIVASVSAAVRIVSKIKDVVCSGGGLNPPSILQLRSLLSQLYTHISSTEYIPSQVRATLYELYSEIGKALEKS